MENSSIIPNNTTANIALIPKSSSSGSGTTDDTLYLSVFLIYVPGIVTNFISIILLLSDLRKTKMTTNVLLLALCTTDFVAVCLSCFWHISRRMGLPMTYDLCAVKSFLHPIMPLLTGSISLLMAVDRFLAFCKPFFYRSNVSKKLWMICVLLVIVFLSVICALPHVGLGSLWTPRYRRGKLTYTCSVFTYQENLTKKIFHISYTSLGFLVVLGIISLNSLVAVAVLRLRHRTIEAQKGRPNQQANRSTEIKFAAIVGLLACVFVVCWLPYNVWVLYKLLNIPMEYNIVSKIHLLGGFNYSTDPFVYIIIRKSNRNLLARIFCCIGIRKSKDRNPLELSSGRNMDLSTQTTRSSNSFSD